MASTQFVVKKVPGKGRGLVAHRDLPKGTVVLTEAPWLVGETPWVLTLQAAQQAQMPEPHMSEAMLLQRYARSGAGLAQWDANDDECMRVVCESTQNVLSDVRAVYDVMCTNNISCGGGRKGLFCFAALFNHSCFPTCAPILLNESTGQTKYRTVRDVKAGEELTILYAAVTFHDDDGRTSKDKKAAFDAEMMKEYGFVCDCDPYVT